MVSSPPWFSSRSFRKCSSVERSFVLDERRFFIASSIWNRAFSRPERLLAVVRSHLSVENASDLLFYAFLSSDVELWDYAFGVDV